MISATNDLNIRLTLTDLATAGLKNASKQVESLGVSLQQTARIMNQAGTHMVLFGGILTGAFGVAINTASQKSVEARIAVDRLKDSMTNIQMTVAESVMPVIQKLVSQIERLANWFMALPESVRNTALQVALLSGAFLLFGGMILRVVSSLFTIGSVLIKVGAGLLALNPVVLLIVAGLGLMVWGISQVITHWDTLGKYATPIIKALEVSINGALGALKALGAWFTGSKALQESSAKSFQTAWEIASGKAEGAGVGMFQNMSVKVKEFEKLLEKLKNLAESGGLNRLDNNFFKGFEYGLQDATRSLANFYEQGKKIATDLANAMTNAFSDFFFSIMTGEFDNLTKIAEDFGRAILRMLANIMAQTVMLQLLTGIGVPISNVNGVTVFGKYHSGGIVRAHSGLAVDEVPIIAQRGEGVLSRRGMQSLGRENFDALNQGKAVQGQNVVAPIVIQAWDAGDIYRNRESISAIIVNAMKTNSGVRSTMKQYS